MKELHGQYMGVAKLSRDAITMLKENFIEWKKKGEVNGKKIETAYMTDLYMELINKGHHLKAVWNDGPWIEVDTPTDMTSETSVQRVKEIVRGIGE